LGTLDSGQICFGCITTSQLYIRMYVFLLIQTEVFYSLEPVSTA